MNSKRTKRISLFDAFYDSSVVTFSSFESKNKRAHRFKDIYSFYVKPGDIAETIDKRRIVIFWGKRPYETFVQGSSWQSFAESGATLIYERDDNGFIHISLYPAQTERQRPIETSIFLNLSVTPKKLQSKKFLHRNWKDLVSYMELTSLEGNPNLFQRYRISYLRNFKYLNVNTFLTPPKVKVMLKEIAKYVITVGLSGFIIFMVNIADQSKSENKLEEINTTLRVISTKLDSICKISSNIETNYLSSNDSLKTKINEVNSGINNIILNNNNTYHDISSKLNIINDKVKESKCK